MLGGCVGGEGVISWGHSAEKTFQVSSLVASIPISNGIAPITISSFVCFDNFAFKKRSLSSKQFCKVLRFYSFPTNLLQKEFCRVALQKVFCQFSELLRFCQFLHSEAGFCQFPPSCWVLRTSAEAAASYYSSSRSRCNSRRPNYPNRKMFIDIFPSNLISDFSFW